MEFGRTAVGRTAVGAWSDSGWSLGRQQWSSVEFGGVWSDYSEPGQTARKPSRTAADFGKTAAEPGQSAVEVDTDSNCERLAGVSPRVKQLAVRTFLALSMLAAARFCPFLSLLMALIGSFLTVNVSLIFPAVLHLKLHQVPPRVVK